MKLFLSTFTNRLDAKGRISVPAKFRAVLNGAPFQGVVCFPSFTDPCIEGVTMGRMEELSEMIDAAFNQFEDTYGAFAHSILADAHELPFDSEGRILLPAELLKHSDISAEATFVGLGKRFQIWEPHSYAGHRASAREQAHKQRALLQGRGGARHDRALKDKDQSTDGPTFPRGGS